jgi:primosomal protein N' (replication factor Y) (superfamily II helicase)
VTSCFADVATDLRTSERHRLLTYAVPGHLAGQVVERGLVLVPLRRDRKLGVVVRLHSDTPDFEVREIEAVAEPSFRISEEQWRLVEWLADETVATLYEAASLYFPPGIARRAVDHITLRADASIDADSLTSVQRELVDLLRERGELSVDAVRRALDRSLTTVIPALEREGVIERRVRMRDGASRSRRIRLLSRTEAPRPDFGRATSQQRALEVLERRLRLSGGSPVPWEDLTRHAGVTSRALHELDRRGLVTVTEAAAPPTAGASSGDGRRLVRLTTMQAGVWRRIQAALRRDEPAEILLHGVTASGKTELYLRAAAWCLSRQRTAIILVPEIGLATQVIHRFSERFPGQAAILHSKLRESERYETWREIANGRIPILVGPRSALFAPMQRIGLVVLDEEHDTAYKQDSSPRYHARDVARKLVEQHNATLLLGSATPDITTYHRAITGEIELLELPERASPAIFTDRIAEVAALELPEVDVVDMRVELREGNTSIFSRRLTEYLERALAERQQAILFLNRRGAATFLQCRACGHVSRCPLCDIPLVFHQDRRQALCHRCGYRTQPPSVCPDCGALQIGYYGTGTQRVEREARHAFPNARVLRWDQDVLRRGVEHADLMRKVLDRQVDIVVGTQMVAKGFDFPDVSVIGVMNADSQLHLPDFRSGERTFQLLMQVAGRAGRRLPGARVVFQSFSPNHYAIQTASQHDYEAFAREELEFRRHHAYPPFARLVRLTYRHTDEVECEAEALRLSGKLARLAHDSSLRRVEILGPTPAFVARIRGYYQWQIVLRGPDAQPLVARAEIDPGWTVDVDPMSIL